jgi:hypothetical protein
MSPAKTATSDADESLKRLGGGRWQTRDERFTIEPQSGTWAVVDAEATDDLGLPLVRGPFRSLTDAKAAIASARTSGPAASPLADRLERGRAAPAAKPTAPTPLHPPKPEAKPASIPTASHDPVASRSTTGAPAATDEPPADPGWMRDLDGPERGRARRLIAQLRDDGVADAESIVRRDLVGDIPALAGHAIASRLAELPQDASTASIVALLADGRNESLGVRWRIVDGEGRPILVEPPKPGRRRT